MDDIDRSDQPGERPNAEPSQEPIHLGGKALGRYRHVCAFFQNREEEYRVVLPFIREGFEHGEKAFNVVAPEVRAEHARRLASIGIDIATAERTGQLELRSWNEAHLRGGHFDENRMLALIKSEFKKGRKQGFRLTRFTAHLEWIVESSPDADAFLEFETKLNYLLPPSEDPVICLYDLCKFSGQYVIDVVRTHPMIIIGGILQENPFFVPPAEFLRELHARRGRARPAGA